MAVTRPGSSVTWPEMMNGRSSEVALSPTGVPSGMMLTTPRPTGLSGMAALGAMGSTTSGVWSTLLMVAQTMKKISSWKTQSIMGVMSTLASGSSGLRSFMGIQPRRATELHRGES